MRWKTPEYHIWVNMRQRCNNPRHYQYRYWGGKGIKVCERWDEDFYAFRSDMGNRPSAKHSIDRIDGNKDYEPSNCRWATPEQQSQNRALTHKYGRPNINKTASGRYMARVRHNGKRYSLGNFDTPEEAAKTIDQFSLE